MLVDTNMVAQLNPHPNELDYAVAAAYVVVLFVLGAVVLWKARRGDFD